MSDPHYMLRSEVTQFSHGVPIELLCRCGACPDAPAILGHGTTLAECSADLQLHFAEHSAVLP